MAEIDNSRETNSAQVDTAISKEIYRYIRDQLKGADRRKAIEDSGRFTGILSRRKRRHKLETLLELTEKDIQFQSLIGHAMEKVSQIPGRSVNELLNHGYMIGLPPFSIPKIASDFKVNPLMIRRIFINQDKWIKLGDSGWIVYDDRNEMIHFSKEKTETEDDKQEAGSGI
ncbi:hypothetical protein ACFL6E_07110 [Candidatus Neomarinimicrobiota bacterium]